ncbi:hypothetical protein [Bacillus sp. HSf4]|nr:hypothetical protein [Bacillus sp. HSf4]WFA06224.1 hypothetical protein P3X63_05385 [Bacillus sp. HSf4]
MKRMKSIIATAVLGGLLVLGLYNMTSSSIEANETLPIKIAEDAVFG